jgi:hypothetical protein
VMFWTLRNTSDLFTVAVMGDGSSGVRTFGSLIGYGSPTDGNGHTCSTCTYVLEHK